NAHLIRFTALGGEPAGTRFTAIQLTLQIRFADLQPRRAAIHHRAQGGAVALAERGDAEALTETVPRHSFPRYSGPIMSRCRAAARNNPGILAVAGAPA